MPDPITSQALIAPPLNLAAEAQADQLGGVIRSLERQNLGHITQYLTVYLGDEIFGMPISKIQSVLTPQHVTEVPLSTGAFLGVMNMRGRVVTVVNLAHRLLGDKAPTPDPQKGMHVVLEYEQELYSIFVDRVGDVLDIADPSLEPPPPTIDKRWREFACHVFKLESDLMVLLDPHKILSFDMTPAAD